MEHFRANKPTPKSAAKTIELPRYRGIPAWKRTLDVIGSAMLLLVLSPILVLVSVYIKLISPGPVFFCQPRVGAGGRNFVIYKFRTMSVRPGADAEHRQYVGNLATQETPIEKPDHKNRMIPGGNFLRTTSIDELPQLLNVLQGTMSLVGPRPDLLQLEDYQPWHLRRFEVLPGMTGLWQVSGKNRLSFREMVELDIRYIDGCNLTTDIKILLKTAGVLVQRDNA